MADEQQENTDIAFSVLELNTRVGLNHGFDFSSRRIQLIGEVNDDMFSLVDGALSLLETHKPNSKSKSRVTLVLNSGGGDPDAAGAISARMQASCCNVDVHAYGTVYSAACLILASGDNRLMAHNASFMYHSWKMRASGSSDSLRTEVEQMESAQHSWAVQLASLTNQDEQFWTDIYESKADKFLTAQQCLEQNIIDSIIKRRKK